MRSNVAADGLTHAPRRQRAIYDRLRDVICVAIRLTALPWLIRQTVARRRVTVIHYHNPEPDTFAQHLRYLRRNYHFISMDHLVDRLERGEFESLPNWSIVITIDDGHCGNAKLREVLADSAVPVLIYLVSGLLDSRRRFWFRVAESRQRAELMVVADSERRALLWSAYRHADDTDYEVGDALTLQQLHEFPESVCFGSHTSWHPVLTKCDADSAQREICDSKAYLEFILERGIDHFAYPHGNWNVALARMVRMAGYRSARTTDLRWVTPASDRFALPAIEVADDASVALLIVQLSGIWTALKSIAKKMVSCP
jgi:peptidoglycan/xylan/chitin deacetylase (PgdA/CDA1 family)